MILINKGIAITLCSLLCVTTINSVAATNANNQAKVTVNSNCITSVSDIGNSNSSIKKSMVTKGITASHCSKNISYTIEPNSENVLDRKISKTSIHKDINNIDIGKTSLTYKVNSQDNGTRQKTEIYGVLSLNQFIISDVSSDDLGVNLRY